MPHIHEVGGGKVQEDYGQIGSEQYVLLTVWGRASIRIREEELDRIYQNVKDKIGE